ncbi:glutaredoxin family protein [Helcobacillus massiliensis]|uniref:Glutaredoxin n=2 Tax=Helcobacillus massiliensis TaxID=521392 RepID=A0A839R2E7_9MICO|nr:MULTISPECIES: glutaredoxin family protein [Helcobacillus]MBB3023006.1 glutaredoxin [Helcobacillus massiliensis]MCG7427973.1 glutaredoxin family protein [Helcobacillus sp. ACRRO]MCT1558361.1 glutaredoxin family protein [Helcobacillus massiliensis]MCT2036587.1 glutaredoxin family protein [Helcobacillus massiliensis]
MTSARITVLDRPGCHLCVEASAVVHRVADELGEAVDHRNIDEDDDLKRRWSLEIPVIMVDGEVVAVYRVTEQELRRALKKKRRRPLIGFPSGFGRRGPR